MPAPGRPTATEDAIAHTTSTPLIVHVTPHAGSAEQLIARTRACYARNPAFRRIIDGPVLRRYRAGTLHVDLRSPQPLHPQLLPAFRHALERWLQHLAQHHPHHAPRPGQQAGFHLTTSAHAAADSRHPATRQATTR